MRSVFLAGTLLSAALMLGATQARAECATGDTACIREQVLSNITAGNGILFNLNLGNRAGMMPATNLSTFTGSSDPLRLAGLNTQSRSLYQSNYNVAVGRLNQFFGSVYNTNNYYNGNSYNVSNSFNVTNIYNNYTFITYNIGQIVVNNCYNCYEPTFRS